MLHSSLAPCQDGSVRLSSGSSDRVGRVEVCLNSTWGTVCASGWDNNDASVLCKSLGYSPYGITALYIY